MKLRDFFLKTWPYFFQSFSLLILLSCFTFSIICLPKEAIALNKTQGADLFFEHCSGCHINGGNIIRRNKTLKIKDLKRNGLDDPEAIARVARVGIGSMSGYEKQLGKGGDQLVANWIWKQSQKAWVQG